MIWLSSNFIMYGIQNKQKIFLLSYKKLDICLINLWDINFCIREKWRFVSLLTKFRVNNNSEMAPSRLDIVTKNVLCWKQFERYLNSFKLTKKTQTLRLRKSHFVLQRTPLGSGGLWSTNTFVLQRPPLEVYILK